MSFVEFVIDVHRTLEDADMAHAFGGALALAYVAEPRGTVDVDVNVFTSSTRAVTESPSGGTRLIRRRRWLAQPVLRSPYPRGGGRTSEERKGGGRKGGGTEGRFRRSGDLGRGGVRPCVVCSWLWPR